MAKFKVFYGLGGGFGGPGDPEILDFETEEKAEDYAWEKACEEYESIAGCHGLRDIADIVEEDNCNCEEAEEIYNDERESWLDYWVERIE